VTLHDQVFFKCQSFWHTVTEDSLLLSSTF